MSEAKAPASQEKLVESYMKWTVDARGLNIMSAKQRASLSRRLLAFLRGRGRTLAKATPVDIDAFISENAHCWKRVTRRTIASRLRDFLGYAAKRKLCAQRLRMSISTPRVYPLEGLPYHAPWEKVVEMLRMAAKDTSRRGRMSYAILMVLATYGVRASEVVRLKLKDIDWRRETIYFRRSKDGRANPLHLAPSAGNAILRYIREARHNESESENLFLREDEPYAAISGHIVLDVAKKALQGAGVEAAHLGPHCIRHSFATHLVNSGRSLKEVSDMLGHRNLCSTAIYAKIDLVSLREVADMDWEESL